MGDVIPFPFVWRSSERRTEEQRRDAALANRPRCTVCKVPFQINLRPPRDGICRACRRDIEANTTPDDPALF